MRVSCLFFFHLSKLSLVSVAATFHFQRQAFPGIISLHPLNTVPEFVQFEDCNPLPFQINLRQGGICYRFVHVTREIQGLFWFFIQN